MRYNSKINVVTLDVLANWIGKNFVILNKQREIEKLKVDTISQVLRKVSAEPPKGKRILEDVAVYISPKNRKGHKEPLKK